MKRIILGISGASGMPLAHTLLTQLTLQKKIEVHLIVSQGAQCVIEHETQLSPNNFTQLAHTSYDCENIAAGPASGSWQHDGMIICPCSMSSLASIAHGIGSNLLHRSADVTLKERRPLIIIPRESPLSSIHLQNMLSLSQNGACIMPFSPAFYTSHVHIEDMMKDFCGRIFDQLHLSHTLCKRWKKNT